MERCACLGVRVGFPLAASGWTLLTASGWTRLAVHCCCPKSIYACSPSSCFCSVFCPGLAAQSVKIPFREVDAHCVRMCRSPTPSSLPSRTISKAGQTSSLPRRAGRSLKRTASGSLRKSKNWAGERTHAHKRTHTFVTAGLVAAPTNARQAQSTHTALSDFPKAPAPCQASSHECTHKHALTNMHAHNQAYIQDGALFSGNVV